MHITRQTLELLDDNNYLFEMGTDKAKEDPFLQKNKIETFLISPQYYADSSVSSFGLPLEFKKKKYKNISRFSFNLAQSRTLIDGIHPGFGV